MTDQVIELILAHRRRWAIGWLVLAVAGGWAAATLSGHLSQSFNAAHRPAFETNRRIVTQFGSGGLIAPIIAVAPREDVAALRRVAGAVSGARTVVAGPGLTGRDHASVAALILPPPGHPAPDANPAALAAVRRATARGRVLITGEQALQTGSQSQGAGLLIETVLGGAGALVVLVLVFGSLLAFVPIVLAAVSILTTFLVLRGLAAGFSVSFVVQFLVGLIGLGVAIDYSLLMIVRWREERDHGADPELAVRRAMRTAGRSILLSGTTVGIGLISLVAVPVPFIRSIGVGGLLIPIISVAANLTLLPAMLATVGPRLDRRRLHGRAVAGAGWERWSRLVVRRRWPAVIIGLAIVGALASFAAQLNPGDPSVNALASSGQARTALIEIERSGLGSGTLTPIEALVRDQKAARAQRQLAAVAGVRAVLAPGGQDWRHGNDRLLAVLPQHDAASAAGRRTLNAIRALGSSTLQIGGPAAQTSDLTNAIYGAFPLMFALIAVLTFALLAVSLRSVVLSLKAIALNILSVAAAFGVVVLVWQDGNGSHVIGGLPGTEAITNWVPLAIFAYLYGLSMDYEVFILTRIREEYDRTHSTNQAVIAGLGRTGRLVTSAALILFLAFVALGATPQTEIKTLATGLAAGIALVW